jgi:hypothetical protein
MPFRPQTTAFTRPSFLSCHLVVRILRLTLLDLYPNPVSDSRYGFKRLLRRVRCERTTFAASFRTIVSLEVSDADPTLVLEQVERTNWSRKVVPVARWPLRKHSNRRGFRVRS